MAVQTKAEKLEIQEKFEDLLSNSVHCKDLKDKELIRRAFDFANLAHKGMRRKSGEPYILHPLAVAKIVTSEIGLGAIAIASSLLHDTVEDTDLSLEDIKHQFGEKIALIIDGLTKISGVFDSNSSLQAENFRKMLLTLSDDVRVILIKIADRLHNMRTLSSLPPNKRIKISGETIYLYAPLAYRLGLYAIKTQLEDLSLKYRHPKIFRDISKKIKYNEKNRIHQINKFSLPIIEKLEANNIKFDINGRPKSIYSIWVKMQNKNIAFEEVYDLLAIRIIFKAIKTIPEKTLCWNIYSLITDIYNPKPERIRDWVSTPKANGYEALHVTVMGPDGKWVEVQIRSTRMDEIAERGFAAHHEYKGIKSASESELDKWINNIRELLENPNSNALEFLDEFKLNLFAAEIFVFTPKGHIKNLPKGATALDFAYEIHTEIGHASIGAKVNHKLVGLNHKLNSGDQVQILTSDRPRIQREWLGYATTAKAKSCIKDYYKADRKKRIEKGKTILEKKLNELNLHPNSSILKKLIPGYNVLSKDELYSKIGGDIITLENLKRILRRKTQNKLIRYWKLQLSKSSSKSKAKKSKSTKEPKSKKFNYKSPFILREDIDESETPYKIAKCCNPIPGDDVIGYKNQNDTVIIHKAKCLSAVSLMSQQGDKVLPAKWTTHKILSFLVRISIKGVDNFGIYNNITTIISKELDVNIRSIKLDGHDGIFEGIIDLYVHNTGDLNNLIMNLMKIKGVVSVNRVEDHGN